MQTIMMNRESLKGQSYKEKNNRVPIIQESHNGHSEQKTAWTSLIPVPLLSDKEVLALSYAYMDSERQEELSDLLADQREETIDSMGRQRLTELMQIYRQGLLRKAEALKVAVERGLRPPLR